MGLFATDGSLSLRANGYSNMFFGSKDLDLVQTFCACAGVTAKIRQRQREMWQRTWTSYEVSFSSVRLARWYQEIGITPRKSLTLGALAVPDGYTFDLVRGLLDGDGNIARYVDKRGRHCFSIRFYSASRDHVDWLTSVLRSRLPVSGALNEVRHPKGLSRRPIFQLAFGRRDSMTLAAEIYRDPESPRLERKYALYASELAGRPY